MEKPHTRCIYTVEDMSSLHASFPCIFIYHYVIIEYNELSSTTTLDARRKKHQNVIFIFTSGRENLLKTMGVFQSQPNYVN